MASPPVDFAEIAALALSDAHGFLTRLFPAGRVNGREYEVGDIMGSPGDSLKINMSTGRWSDFAAGIAGGDLISLYAAAHGIKQIEAARQIAGYDNESVVPRISNNHVDKPKKVQVDEFSPLPVPISSNPGTLSSPKYGKPSNIYEYKDATGQTQFFICRFDLPPGPDGKKKKEFNSYSFGTYKGKTGWHWKSWPKDRLLYGLDLLAQKPKAPVIVVEGEKACEAARIKFPGNVCITWPGGGNAVEKTNWTPLQGRKVMLWPDADEPGHKAMHNLAEKLVSQNIVTPDRIYYLTPPQTVFKGWDAADFVACNPPEIDLYVLNLGIKPWHPKQEILPPQTDLPPDVNENFGGTDDTDPGDLPELPPDQLADIPPPTMADLAGVRKSDVPTFSDFKNQRPISTIENMAALLNHLRVSVKYNVISKSIEIGIPDIEVVSDMKDEASLTWIRSECLKASMSVDGYEKNVEYIAAQNPHNPILEWIESKPWDGKSRLDEFYATVKSTNEEFKKKLIYRWLLSCVAAVAEPEGVYTRGVLTFTGNQGIGKTYWFNKLVPAELSYTITDGVSLNPSDKDSVKHCISHWLVELGELDATFKKADIAALKAFLTKKKDAIRLPYGRAEHKFPRRTVFFASVNELKFLYDPTGNMRFWSIHVLSINYLHEIDVQQLWAEVLCKYHDGQQWVLTREENAELVEANTTHEVESDIMDMLKTFYDWHAPLTRWLTATQIALEIKANLNQKNITSEIGKCVRKLNHGITKKLHGKTMLNIPDCGIIDQSVNNSDSGTNSHCFD